MASPEAFISTHPHIFTSGLPSLFHLNHHHLMRVHILYILPNAIICLYNLVLYTYKWIGIRNFEI